MNRTFAFEILDKAYKHAVDNNLKTFELSYDILGSHSKNIIQQWLNERAITGSLFTGWGVYTIQLDEI